MNELREFQGEWGGHWRYDPAAYLGQPGGFATVHPGAAADGTPVAVKVLTRQLPGGPELRPRLRRREAAIAEKLRGAEARHLISILDVAEVEEELLIVMPLAERSLATAIPAPDEATAVGTLQDIAAGLRELHQAGVIHRDLKPGNVLLHEGRWKVADFGIARDVELGTQTETFLGAGTPAYMAPELWRLQSPNVRADLYALGCIAYDLLTGAPPFSADDLDGFRRLHTEAIPPPLPDQVNRALRALVARLLSKDPAERPQDARAVEERLARISAPLSDLQERLRVLEAQHTEERGAEAARRAAEEAEAARLANLRRQALADLEELLQDALADLGGAIAGVTLRKGVNEHTLAGPDATLTIRIWPPWQSPVKDDLLLLASEVNASNRRARDGRILANFVAEIDEGAVVWNCYRFRAMTGLVRYDYGPREGLHGLQQRDFQQDRQHMFGGVMHVWSLSRNRLTPDVVATLYAEAMELPAAGG